MDLQKNMFTGLLGNCIIETFGELLASNSKGPRKYENNLPCKARTATANINSNETINSLLV